MGLNKVLLKELPYSLAVPLLGIHTEESRTERDTCTPMLLAALLQQPGHGSNLDVHRQTNDKTAVVHLHNGILPAIKKNAFESVLMRRMKLEPIIQSEVSQKEKHQYSMLTHIYEI